MAGKARTVIAALALILSPFWTAQVAAEQTPAQQAKPDSIDNLARDVGRLQSLRQVKDLQRTYAQYAQFGLWSDMSDLFAQQGRIEWGDQIITGRGAIGKWLQDRGGPQGLAPGALNTEFIDTPLVNLSADGLSAQGRWSGLAFRGDGAGKTVIEGGIYENLYVREGGRWKIAALRYHPQYEGDYVEGWNNNGNQDLPVIPYHFTPDTAGIPIPASDDTAPASRTTLAALSHQIAALNEEDAVRNIQSAYGYYVDRKMWDDVVDLFADDGVVEIAGVGTFEGKTGVRQAMERMGPQGLTQGQLNDRPQFDTIVKVAPGGNEAFARGTELGMLGNGDKAGWEINVFRNRFVKEGGLWKIRELRIQPLMKADYATGWGNGALGKGSRPALPAFLGGNPATGKAVNVAGLSVMAAKPLTGAIRTAPPAAAPTLGDLRRRYMRSFAFDGTENVSAAYGYYLDDFQWPQMAGIFAVKGNKQSPFAGYYFGRDRIAAAATAMYGTTSDPLAAMRKGVALHWRVQPVIHVSHDGRSTNLRTRLFQPRTGKYVRGSGEPNRSAVFYGGMYPNDQVVLEDGIWRLWTLTIDEPYFETHDWQGGWAVIEPTPPGGPSRASPLMQRYPPDLPITELGRREEGFRGGTGTTVNWPDILPMWFHYRNPVSGRTPERYWPNCVPCEKLPQTSMDRNGYQMPPTGPEIDGIELKK